MGPYKIRIGFIEINVLLKQIRTTGVLLLIRIFGETFLLVVRFSVTLCFTKPFTTPRLSAIVYRPQELLQERPIPGTSRIRTIWEITFSVLSIRAMLLRAIIMRPGLLLMPEETFTVGKCLMRTSGMRRAARSSFRLQAVRSDVHALPR